jgi:glutamate dehydrogenase/leucine dehydrogenase
MERVIVNRSLETVHAPAEPVGKRGPLQEIRDQFERAAARLRLAPRTASGDVDERAEREQASPRDAAYVIAVERVAPACRERGWV